MNPNQVPIHYTLNLEQVNLVVSALAKLPFEQVEQFLVAFRGVALQALKDAEEQAKAAEVESQTLAFGLQSRPANMSKCSEAGDQRRPPTQHINHGASEWIS